MNDHFIDLNLPDATLLFFFFRSISSIEKYSSKPKPSKKQNKSQSTRKMSLKNVSDQEWHNITINNLIMPMTSKDDNHNNQEFISNLVSDHCLFNIFQLLEFGRSLCILKRYHIFIKIFISHRYKRTVGIFLAAVLFCCFILGYMAYVKQRAKIFLCVKSLQGTKYERASNL